MAEQQQSISAFPTPPPFYKHFTKQNIGRLRQLRNEAGIPTTHQHTNDEAKQDVDILSLPPELRFLIPPLPPSGDITAFGASASLDAPAATLTESGVEQLYPEHPSVKQNPQPHLIALTRSLMTTFLSITGILAQNPELFPEKIEDLQTIMFNIHDLINQYRPHQSRESLIWIMEERVQSMREEVRRIQEGKEKLERVMRDLREQGEMQPGEERKIAGRGDAKEVVQSQAGIARETRQKAAWDTLERAMAAEE